MVRLIYQLLNLIVNQSLTNQNDFTIVPIEKSCLIGQNLLIIYVWCYIWTNLNVKPDWSKFKTLLSLKTDKPVQSFVQLSPGCVHL